MNSSNKGFSLIELIIVILIIAIIAAVAIPNLLAARRSANQGSTISSLRSLHTAQLTYFSSLGKGNYAGTNGNVGDTVGLDLLQKATLIDPVLGSGTKSGYNFVGAVILSSPASPATFFFSANPVSDSGVTQSGVERYNITETGVLRSDRNNLLTAFTSLDTSSANALNN